MIRTTQWLLAALLLAPAAHAATITQVSGFPSSSLNFVVIGGAAGSNVGTSVTYGGTTFTSSADTLEINQVQNYVDNNFANGTKLIGPCGLGGFLSCSGTATLRITFAMPTLGFSLSVDDFSFDPETFRAQAFSGSTAIGNALTATSTTGSANGPAILAGLSDTAITSVVISGGTGDFVVGNVATVPEPASLALLGAGLASVVLRRRR